MKKNLKLIYIIELALLFLVLILCGSMNVMANTYRKYLAITFLFLLIIPCYFIFGLAKDNNYNKYSGVRVVLIHVMIFGIIGYLLGLILGFNNGYKYSLDSLVNGVIPIILLTVSVETLRFIVLKKAFYNKKVIVLFTLLTSIIYILLYYSSIDTSFKLFVFICTVVLPFIAYESLCSYLSINLGLAPCIIFKIIVFLYPYVIPIVPNYGDYLKTVLDLILAYSIFVSINKGLLAYDKSNKKVNRFNFSIFTVPILIVLILLIIFVSGIFKHQLIAIASNSMNPVFYRGDALMIDKCDINNIKVGDILIFQSDKRIVSHRVIKKYKVNDEVKLLTKGDNNKQKDDIIIDNSNYIGKGIFVIKYIGYPTVWLNEKFMED